MGLGVGFSFLIACLAFAKWYITFLGLRENELEPYSPKLDGKDGKVSTNFEKV